MRYVLLGLVALASLVSGWLVLLRPGRCVHRVRLRDHCVLCCQDPCHDLPFVMEERHPADLARSSFTVERSADGVTIRKNPEVLDKRMFKL